MKSKDRCEIIWLIGNYLITLMASNLLISSLLFMLGIPITVINFPLSMIVSLMIFILIYNEQDNNRELYISIAISFFIIISTIFISAYISDFSWDGNMYHKVAVGMLRDGWNPSYQNSTEFHFSSYNYPFNAIDTSVIDLWIDHYAKGAWIFAASLYKIFGDIEASKIMNLLAMISCICIAYSYLRNRVLNRINSLIVALIVGITPVTLVQILSYYVDGLLANTLYILIWGLVILADEKYNINKQKKYLLLLSTIIILVNIKFTGLGLCAVFCFVFYMYILIKNYKDKKQFIKKLKELTVFFITAVVFSTVLVGGNTYIKNIVDHKHPFYPLFGKEKVDIMTNNQPEIFEEISGLEKMFLSTFGMSENISAADKKIPKLKIPFSIYKQEFGHLSTVDTRIGGFGVWFSGIFIISILILCIASIKKKLYEKELINYGYLILGTSTILLFLLEDSWWARYSPHMYLYVVIGLIIILKWTEKSQNTALKLFKMVFVGVIAINVLFLIGCNTTQLIKKSTQWNAEKLALRKLAQDENIILKVAPQNTSLMGALYNMNDITDKYIPVIERTEDFIPVYGHYLYYTTEKIN